MRLLQLEIENFRVLRSASLSFLDAVIGVVGPNGAGKSSLVEAIAWALYGNTAARSGKDEIRSVYASRGDDCRVRLVFALNGDQYTVERSLIGIRERHEAQVYRDGRLEATGAAEVGKFVGGLLGLDWRGFLTSFLARQQELNALADLAPQQRRDHLAGMLGIERLDRVLQRLKQDRRILDERAERLSEQAGRGDELSRLLAETTEHMVRLEPQVRQAQGALEQATAVHKAAEAAYREHQEKELRCSEIDTKLEAARQARKSLADQVAAAETRRAELEAGRDRLEALKTATGNLAALRDRRELLRKAAAQAELARQVREQWERTERNLVDLTTRAVKQRDQLAELKAVLGGLPPDPEALVERTGAELERARSGFTETRAEAASLEKELSKLGEQVTAIGQIGPEAVCDRCRRPFGDDLPGIRHHLESELTGLTRALEERQNRLNELTRQGQSLKEKLAEHQAAARKRHEAAVQSDNLAQQLHETEERLAEQTRRKAELEARLRDLGPTEADATELSKVEQEVAALERLRDEALNLQGRLNELPALTDRLAELKKQIEVKDRQIGELEAARGTIAYDVAESARMDDDFELAKRNLEGARQTHTEAVKELEITRAQQRSRLEEQTRLLDTVEKLESCREEVFYSEKLSRLFTDFRKVMIAGIRPRLADLAGRLMGEMSGGRYGLVDLDPDYNLRIMDFGHYYGVDRFSGGEKDLASLCLRLAISLALTESAGMTRSFVILDEVFGSQDSGRRDLIVEALGGLKARFPQMILITHLEELKHKVESLIEVVPTAGGWSEVHVNGGAADE